MTKDLPAHGVIRPLTVHDLKQVMKLETTVFPPQEAPAEETVRYRLTTCPELCAGVFIRTFGDHIVDDNEHEDDEEEGEKTEADGAGQQIEDRDSDYEDIDEHEDSFEHGRALPKGKSSLQKEELIAHIMATKIVEPFVTDESMGKPELDGHGRTKDRKDDKRGHREEGRTIAIHSVSVHPDYQGQSIGTIMLRDYIQRLTTQHIADRMALIAHEGLVPFYERVGFQNGGESDCKHGGGNWVNCWIPLSDNDEDDDEE